MFGLSKNSNSHPSTRSSMTGLVNSNSTGSKIQQVDDRNCNKNKVYRASRIPIRTNRIKGPGPEHYAFPDKEIVIIKKNKPWVSQCDKLPPICPPKVNSYGKQLEKPTRPFYSSISSSANQLRTQTRTLERFPKWKSPPDYLPVIINNRTIPPKKPKHFKPQMTNSNFKSSVVPLPKINNGPTFIKKTTTTTTTTIVNRYSRKPGLLGTTTRITNGVQQQGSSSVSAIKKVTSLPLLPARMIQRPSKNDSESSNSLKINPKLIHTHTTPNSNKLFKYESKYAQPQPVKKPAFIERIVAKPVRRKETKNLPPIICPPIPTATKISPFHHHQHQQSPKTMLPVPNIHKPIPVTRVRPQFSKIPVYEPPKEKMNQLAVPNKWIKKETPVVKPVPEPVVFDQMGMFDEIREYNEKKAAFNGLELATILKLNEAPTPKTTLTTTSESEESLEENYNENDDEDINDNDKNDGNSGGVTGEVAGFVAVEYVEHSSDEYYYSETSDEDEELRSPAYYDGDSESA